DGIRDRNVTGVQTCALPIFIEIPLALMDTSLLSQRYLGLDLRAGRQRALLTLETLRRWGGAAALLWHNDNLPPNEADGYGALYEIGRASCRKEGRSGWAR